jgi:gas vesicle protein
MSDGIITSIFGLIGVVLGAIITFISQIIIESKREKYQRRMECIKKINIIPNKINYLDDIVNKIIEFIKIDFRNINNEDINDIYNGVSHFYSEKNPYFWDTLSEDLYILLPKTSKNICFQILDKKLIETKNMSENINDYLESSENILSGLIDLQESFLHSLDDYLTSKYMIYMLKNEYYKYISTNKIFGKQIRNYYKNNIKSIKSSIKKLFQNIPNGT